MPTEATPLPTTTAPFPIPFPAATTPQKTTLTFVFENEYEVKNKAKSLMGINRDKFTYKKMTELLNNIVDKYTENIPSQVSLKLPKLKKVKDKNTPTKLKLPTLKKVTNPEGAPA